MSRVAPLVLVLGVVLGCEAAEPPAPLPDPSDHFSEDLAKIGAELLAGEQRENDRLHQELATLDAQIAAARQEAMELLLHPPPRSKQTATKSGSR